MVLSARVIARAILKETRLSFAKLQLEKNLRHGKAILFDGGEEEDTCESQWY